MPDLVYNIKFQIDEASRQSVTQFTSGVGDAGNTGKTDKTKKSIRQLINEYTLLGREAENTRRSLVSSTEGLTEFGVESNITAERLEGLRESLLPAIESLEEIANSSKTSTQEQLRARAAINQLITTYDRAGKTTAQYAVNQKIAAEAMETVTQDAQRMNASFSTSNQVLFGFSDLVQDSAQFSYGFSSGMRAIGNNIGFTGELLANLNRRVAEYNQVHGPNATSVTQELRNSFRGAGGLILGLNLAITAFTVISRQMEVYKKKTEEAKPPTVELSGEIEKLSSALDSLGVFGDDFLGIARTRFEIGQLDIRIAQLQKTVFTEEDQKRLNELLSQRRSIEEAVGARTSEQANNLFSQIDAEIDLLKTKRDIANLEGATQKELEEAQKRRNELQKEFAESGSVSTNQLVSSALIQNDLLKMEEEMSKILQEEARIRQEEIGIIDQRRLESLNTFSDNVVDFEDFLTTSIRSTNQLISDLVLQNEQDSVETIQDIREVEAQLYDEIERRKLQSYQSRTNAEIEIERFAATQKINAYSQIASGIMSIGSQIFGANKEIAIAETLISTYFSAQKAYQSVIASPQALLLGAAAEPIARRAAAAAVVQGLARVAAIASTEIGSGVQSSAGSSGGGRFGFQSTNIEGAQTFRTPGFMPSNEQMQPKFVINQELKADRKQLYILNKLGEEEYRQIKV